MMSNAKKEVYNFSPGPAALPREVMEQVQAEFLDYQGSGVSIVEVSHRGPIFTDVAEQLHANMRQVLSVPDDYELVFTAGGGQGQFSCLPLNLLGDFDSAAYLVSGHWSRKAFVEAKSYTNAVCVADADSTGYASVPEQASWAMPESAAYLYCCDNETVHGLKLPQAPTVEIPVVCDMTSSLMTGSVDWSRYQAVIAGCQKNIAPAGMTVVVIHKELLARQARSETPGVLNYQNLVKSKSLANTPCTFSWYVANLVCQWVIKEGGVDEMQRRMDAKSSLLYDFIDQSDFYTNHIEPAYRSSINVCFKLANEDLQADFLAGAEAGGLLSLKGHRAVGGLRANLYNGVPVAGAEKLVAYMKGFAEKTG
jgi:phosphoserine aminotransferase